jgi:hypothetical protein
MLLAVHFYLEGIFLGKIGVAHFVLDHDPRKLTGRPVPLSFPLGWKKEAKDDVNKIGDKNIEDESKKTRDHPLNLAYSAVSVKPTKLLILDFPKSKMEKDHFLRRRHGFSIHWGTEVIERHDPQFCPEGNPAAGQRIR